MDAITRNRLEAYIAAGKTASKTLKAIANGIQTADATEIENLKTVRSLGYSAEIELRSANAQTRRSNELRRSARPIRSARTSFRPNRTSATTDYSSSNTYAQSLPGTIISAAIASSSAE